MIICIIFNANYQDKTPILIGESHKHNTYKILSKKVSHVTDICMQVGVYPCNPLIRFLLLSKKRKEKVSKQ